MSILLSVDISLSKRSRDKLAKDLIKEMSGILQNAINDRKVEIEAFVRQKAKSRLHGSPEIASLLDDNGKLRIELGLKDANSVVPELIEAIADKIKIRINKTNGNSQNINIDISVYIDANYADFYSKKYSSYVSSGGTRIEWLNWLLEAGDSDVIFNYRIRYGVEIGRSGGAVMTPSRTANWRVPPEFSGTSANNFITRSFDGIEKDLLSFIETILRVL